MSEDKPQPDFMGMFHDFHARLKTPEISFGEWDDQFGALHNEVLDLNSSICTSHRLPFRLDRMFRPRGGLDCPPRLRDRQSQRLLAVRTAVGGR